MEDEVLLEFKRFSADKQEQIRQLVAYTQLMGLTGKDLVSIGGKLDRIQRRKELESNLAIGLSYECVIAGQSKKDKIKNENRKWYYTDGHGTKWMFNGDYYGISISLLQLCYFAQQDVSVTNERRRIATGVIQSRALVR